MKKSLALVMAFGLSACANQEGMGIGQSVAASMLENKCHSYLQSQQVWTIAQVALGARAQEYANRVCGCASHEAAKNMTTAQMVSLANESTRTQTLLELLVPTVSSCYQQLVR